VTKILLIEPDPARAAALAAALGGGGAEVRIAPDGFYALTAIERERPDLVVAGSRVGGIGVGELGAIVRSDPALAGVRLALYADPAAPPADLNGGGLFDLVLDAAATPGELAARLRHLAGLPARSAPVVMAPQPSPQLPQQPPEPPPLRKTPTAPAGPASPATAAAPANPPSGFATAELPAPDTLARHLGTSAGAAAAAAAAAGAAGVAGAAPPPVPPAPPAAAPPRPAAAEARPQPAPDLSGSLGVLDLMELSQAFSLASKTGQLFLDCPRGEGCIYFELGKVIHATIRERTGREAFSEILQATLREKNIAFRFAPREPVELTTVPRSIDLTVQHLLLSFAVDFDETKDS
jgi:CheY-like chemotaxis protein